MLSTYSIPVVTRVTTVAGTQGERMRESDQGRPMIGLPAGAREMWDRQPASRGGHDVLVPVPLAGVLRHATT